MMDLPSVQDHPKHGGRRRHKHKPSDEALCKYASKACYKPRVVKKTGELHRYCDHHRQQANRNQRRLELRRRLREHDGSCSPSSGNRSLDRLASLATAVYTSDEALSDGYSDDGFSALLADHKCYAAPSVAGFEPFREPVTLLVEDLASLFAIFTEPTEQSAALWAMESTPLYYELQC